LDYRKLNSKSLPDRYSIRTIEECITEVGHADSKIFSCLDLTSGFWQMPLKESSRHYTAFTIPGCGQYEWRSSPMGLTGCPASFSRLMELVMRDASNIITYIDDVLIHSKDHTSHLDHLQVALERIKTHNLKLNMAKCIFGSSSVAYLGHNLTATGISPGTDKAQAVRDTKPPTSVKHVKSFVGLCNYFRIYIRRFAQRAAPLFALTRQDCQWKGGRLPEEALSAFLDLRQAICDKPILSYPSRIGEYRLYVDAAQGDAKNKGGLGAVLMQHLPNGKQTVLGFASRRLDKHEKNYPAFLLELAASVYGMDYFETHLKGRKFGLYTDHKPLTNLSITHKKTLATLQHKMQIMCPEFRYVAGENNKVADFLSRYQGIGIAMVDASNHRVKTLQSLDPNLQPMFEAVKQFLVENPDSVGTNYEIKTKLCRYPIAIKNNILIVKIPKTSIETKAPWRVVVPNAMQKELLKEAHNSSIAGHGGAFKTAKRVQDTFWWAGMGQDIAEHVKQCQVCQKANNQGSGLIPPLQPLPMPSGPNERIHVDLFGPLKTSQEGNKVVIVITDAFTKLVKIGALKDKEASTVANAILSRWIYVHGVPKKIQSDGGKEFCNELQTALYDSLNIEHNITTPYHPQTNAQVEIFNKTMAKYFRTALADSEKSTLDWEIYLGPLMFSYNTAVNKSTLVSPFYATFGYDPRTPLWESPDQILGVDQNVSQPKAAKALHEIRKAQWTARKVVHHNGQHAKELQKKYFDTANDVEWPNFEKDDPVWVRKQPTPGANPKLECKWEPGSIVERITSTTFKVFRPQRSHKKMATLNVNQLKQRILQESDKPKEGLQTRSRTKQQQAIISLIRDTLSYDEIIVLLKEGYQLLGAQTLPIPPILVTEEDNEEEDFFDALSQPPTPSQSSTTKRAKEFKTKKMRNELKKLANFLQSGAKDLVAKSGSPRLRPKSFRKRLHK
jgi:hypothetical protein